MGEGSSSYRSGVSGLSPSLRLHERDVVVRIVVETRHAFAGLSLLNVPRQGR